MASTIAPKDKLDDEGGDEESPGAHISRLKAAVHYTVGKLCDESAARANGRQDSMHMEGDSEHQRRKHKMHFSRGVIAAISDTTFKLTQLFAADIIAFAKHANRNTVSVDDIKLLVRRNPALVRVCIINVSVRKLDHITNLAEEMVKDKRNSAAFKRHGAGQQSTSAASRKRPAPTTVTKTSTNSSIESPASIIDEGAGPSKHRFDSRPLIIDDDDDDDSI